MTDDLEAYRCAGCPMSTRDVVPPEGPADPILVVVGEAPGDKEVALKRPFVGHAGDNLRDALAGVGIDDGRVHFTNSILCHPGRNPLTGEYLHPSPADIAACRGRLLAEIADTRATKILLVGGHAGRAVVGRVVVVREDRCSVAGLLTPNLLSDGVEVAITYHPTARRADPTADIVADLRCLLKSGL